MWTGNRSCRPSGHHWDYYIRTLSLKVKSLKLIWRSDTHKWHAGLGTFSIKMHPRQGLYSLRRHRLIGIGIHIINLRRSSDRLRFIIGIHIPVRRHHYSEYRLSVGIEHRIFIMVKTVLILKQDPGHVYMRQWAFVENAFGDVICKTVAIFLGSMW